MARRSTTPETAPTEAEQPGENAVGKGRPTPTRREREAARKRPLVPTDRKAAAAANRDKMAEQRERQRQGLAAGDERYLPARDKGPQRRFARDFVDARFNFGEWLLPFVALLLVAMFVPQAGSVVLIAVWAYVALTILDCLYLGWRLDRRLAEKFGGAERGLRWYASMRAIQLRAMRMPKPQVKRGQSPA